MPVNSQMLTRSYGGAIYEGGVQLQGAQSFTWTRGVSTTSVGVLDQKAEVLVEDSITYTLTFTEVLIDSRLTQRVLEADATGEQLVFSFITETRRNDGQKQRLKCDGGTISGDFILDTIERGSARTRDLEFQFPETPQLLSMIS